MMGAALAAPFAFHIRKAADECEVALVGELTEHSRLDDVIAMLLRDGGPGRAVTVDCGEIRRINSFGCRSWTEFLERVARLVKKVSVRRLPPGMVHQANLVENFLGKASVESYFAPYACSKCEAEHLYLARGRSLPDVLDCPGCRLRTMHFDGDSNVYRSFLLAAAQRGSGRLKMLLVDDEGFSRSMFRLGLRTRFDLDVVEGYDQAVSAIKGRDYDIIVSDYKMPGQSGTDLLSFAAKWLPDSLRILLTAYTPADLDDLRRRDVVHAVMQKPASPVEVEARVREELEKRSSRV